MTVAIICLPLLTNSLCGTCVLNKRQELLEITALMSEIDINSRISSQQDRDSDSSASSVHVRELSYVETQRHNETKEVRNKKSLGSKSNFRAESSRKSQNPPAVVVVEIEKLSNNSGEQVPFQQPNMDIRSSENFVFGDVESIRNDTLGESVGMSGARVGNVKKGGVVTL
jgi:hypothetical protein